MLKNYKFCIFCYSKKRKILFNQTFKDNFYLRAIRNDLNLTISQLKKMKVYECQSCKLIQNDPWFTEEYSRKIYSNIYGQHNRSWQNLINFVNHGKNPNHGDLFNILIKNLNIKSYAEHNSPFMGIFLNFLKLETNQKKFFYKKLFTNTLKYLSSRQVAGKSRNFQKKSFLNSKKYLSNLRKLKKNYIKSKRIKKYLFVDNSNLSWGSNDNYESVNSRSFATEFLDLEIKNFHDDIKKKLDLFAFFHTLDHTFKPQEVLNRALAISKYTLVYCHINPELTKQHLFSLTKNFLKYLNKKKIYTLNLTNLINKEYKSPELYFLCSKRKIKSSLLNKF